MNALICAPHPQHCYIFTINFSTDGNFLSAENLNWFSTITLMVLCYHLTRPILRKFGWISCSVSIISPYFYSFCYVRRTLINVNCRNIVRKFKKRQSLIVFSIFFDEDEFALISAPTSSKVSFEDFCQAYPITKNGFELRVYCNSLRIFKNIAIFGKINSEFDMSSMTDSGETVAGMFFVGQMVGTRHFPLMPFGDLFLQLSLVAKYFRYNIATFYRLLHSY